VNGSPLVRLEVVCRLVGRIQRRIVAGLRNERTARCLYTKCGGPNPGDAKHPEGFEYAINN
jgi:hypothetical protein